jgi:hypothetical protein
MGEPFSTDHERALPASHRDATESFGVELSVAILQNYLLLMFTTALVLPATLLAWRDVALDNE